MADPREVSDAWRALGQQLAGFRKAAGHTQHSLAPRVNYGRSTIANVEVGRQQAPRTFWERCDQFLAADGQLTAAYDRLQTLRHASHRADRVEPARGATSAGHFDIEPSQEPDMHRRDLLTAIAAIASSGAIAAPSSPRRRIGLEDVAELASRTARLRRLDNYLGGADTLPLYESEIHRTITLVRTGIFGEATGNAMLSLLAEQTQLAGWAAFDAGSTHHAATLFARSRSIALETSNQLLAANALALLAYQRASLAQPDVAAAEASQLPANAGHSPVVRALLLERLAFTYAVAGLERQAGHALDAAQDALDQPTSGPAPDWATWVDRDEIRIMTGRVWSELRRPLRALPELEETLRRFDDTYARDKALYSTWLADAYLDAGECEQAAEVLIQSKRLCDGIASPRPAARIDAVRERLTPYRQVAAVAAVLA
ncbi:helix-turn-helix transcriptional regulator [Micromonospora sp. WMMD710]|uniref:helix-turn-helix domain-containing protein n=1 Tax=Micromonospora sp. WMMD710 TaxID=3016085 RepID=UPI00241761B1|nr:helix-turn-helix transcriptional regulator [Micromonospora sp. WMMD710]MDG4761333.1 helix-turn-helix transcriptional regulator [Micromonospora sp. WMMD710]